MHSTKFINKNKIKYIAAKNPANLASQNEWFPKVFKNGKLNRTTTDCEEAHWQKNILNIPENPVKKKKQPKSMGIFFVFLMVMVRPPARL